MERVQASRGVRFGRDVFSMGQLARIFGVAARTVSKWVDSGEMRGYRIPGSSDRRVTLAEAVRFSREHNIPATFLLSSQLVLAGFVPSVVAAVREGVKAATLRVLGRPTARPVLGDELVTVTVADTLAGACLAVEASAAIHAIGLDASTLGRAGTREAGRAIRQRYAEARLLVLVGDDEAESERAAASAPVRVPSPLGDWWEYGFSEVVCPPVSPDALALRLMGMAGLPGGGAGGGEGEEVAS